MTKTILVVDDSPNVRTLVREYLTAEGFRVVLANDGRAALFTARTEKPDLILLDIMMPIMGQATLESVGLLAQGTMAFIDLCAVEMEANAEACEASVEKSLAMVTSLNPYIGYEKAAALAKEAFRSGKTIRQLCLEQKILPEAELAKVLEPWRMTEPQA